MKRLIVTSFAVCVALGSLAQTASAEEKVLLDLERGRSEAIANGTGSFLNNIYHDQFRGVTATGTIVDKSALLNIFKDRNPDVIFTTDEMKANLYGYAGVVSGKLIGKDKDGKVLSQSRFIHVYVKRNGQWKIMEGQATKVEE